MEARLLTRGDRNPKVYKGQAAGWSTAILHLAPADVAGRGTVCPWSTAGCRAACLNKAGRGGIIRKGERTNNIQRARVRKTRWFFDDRPGFLSRLDREIALHVARARVSGLRPAVRLNGTSDISWERVAPGLFDRFPGVMFYDYTKSRARALAAHGAAPWPANYDLTFSWSGENAAECAEVLAAGGRVAVPFAGKVPVGGFFNPRGAVLGKTTEAFPIIDGDASDLRFLDGRGVVVGLKAKGPAKRDRSGFVVALK